MAMRCSFSVVVFTVSCLILSSPAAWSARSTDEPASFPSRPIRILIGFTPGGQPDIRARVIGPKLHEALGQQVVVDNRPGAGSTIATKILANTNPDGHTLLSVSASHVISPSIYAKLPYNPLKDFAGVTMTTTACYLLSVPPSLGAKTVQELVALAKAKPGQLNFASAGTGSATHIAAEMFKYKANIDAVHVPYKGIPEALTDTMTGRVQFFMAPIGSSVTLVRDGKLRALGVSARQRAQIHPDIPTTVESGLPGFHWGSWNGLLAPAKTLRAIVSKLNRELTRILSLPDVRQRLTAIGLEPALSTSAQFDKMIAEQLTVVAELPRNAGIKPQ